MYKKSSRRRTQKLLYISWSIATQLNVKGGESVADFDINATLYPIIQGVVELMPSFLDLILAVVPVIIVMSVVGFIIKFWDQIVRMMQF